MQDSRLDLLDKLILSYVSTWEQKGKVCYAKDGFFSSLFGESEDAVTYSILKLHTLKLLHMVKGPGGRVLQTLDSIARQEEREIDIFEGLY